MKTLLFWTALAIVLCAVRAHAQTVPPNGMDEKAKHEIARRGSMVVSTGTIRSGLVEAALAPPADDSAKWFITLVGKPGDPDFEKLKHLIATDPAVRPWIDATDSKESTTHYQVRSIDDATQKDWLKGLAPAIEKYGLPAVVVQPPRNGQFGDPAAIVKMIHGTCTGEVLASKLREGVITYVTKIDKPIQSGISQPAPIAALPPFNVAPTPPATAPTQQKPPLPIDWPQASPSVLSIDQIRALCPGASPEFLLNCVEARETNSEIVKLRWLVYQQSHPVPVPHPEPSPPLPVDLGPAVIVPARENADRLKPELQRDDDVSSHPEEPVAQAPSGLLAYLIAGLLIGTFWTIIATISGSAIVSLVVRTKGGAASTASMSQPAADPSSPQPVANTWKPPGSSASG